MTNPLSVLLFFPPIWIGFLLFGGFSVFDTYALDRYPLFSKTIDLSERNQVTWEPPTHKWIPVFGLAPYKGKAMLSLVFGTVPEGSGDETDVEVVMSAFGTNNKNEKHDRWIIDDYIKSNKPFSKPRNIWETGHEWGLGFVHITGDEEITINMLVIKPNISPKLHCPKLKLVVYHDDAWVGYGRRIYCNFFNSFFSILAVVIYIFLANQKTMFKSVQAE